MEKPTDKQLKEAKEFLYKRVQVEISMQSRLESYIIEAAERIYAVSRKYSIRPSLFKFSINKQLDLEVNEVIKWLKGKINELTFSLASSHGINSEEEKRDYFYREIKGKTFNQRLNIYNNRLKHEIEAFVAASLIQGLTKTKFIKTYREQYKNPYNNSIITKSGQTAAVRSSGVTYGVGRSNVAFNMLNNLSRHAIADTWMHADMERAISKGAIGFYSYRGSSFPCETCDDMTGFHTFADPYPPYHQRCVCFAVPVYN